MTLIEAIFRPSVLSRLLYAGIASGLFLIAPAKANVVGPDTQNFNTTPDGLDFVTVQTSEVLRPGILNLGLFGNYAVNTLPYFPSSTSTGQSSSGRVRDELTGVDLNVAVGLFHRFEMGLSLPHIVMQNVHSDDTTLHGQFAAKGMTEIRPMAKMQLLGGSTGGVAAITSVGFNMIQDNPWLGDGAAPILNFELAGDATLTPGIAGALNVGWRQRKPGTKIPGTPVEPLGNQFIASGATSFLIPGIQSKVITEVFGSWPALSTTNLSDRALSSAEALIGIKHDATDHLSLHMGGGAGLGHGISSPDWRLYAGLNYTLGPMFGGKEHDNIGHKAVRQPKPTVQAPPQKNIAATPLPADEPPTVDEVMGKDPFAHEPEVGEETIVINDVLFAFDKDNVVLPGSFDILHKLAAYLRKSPPLKHMVIEGHTDYIGSQTYNQGLSERRAATIRRVLVEKMHFDPKMIDAMGFGEMRPIADNGNYQGRQKNRRVEFKIVR